MQKVLLTNFNMLNYSGSEIDTLTIANYFLKKGYLVHIFTLQKGNPLIKMVNNNIKVITLNEIDNLYNSYEIIWSHHFPLLDYLLFSLKIKGKYIFYISLSPFNPYEAIPSYHNKLSLIGAITKEVYDKLILEGVNLEKLVLFPNYVIDDFFNYKIKKIQEIKKICIVSNHVPLELIKLKELCQKRNILVDIYGKDYEISYVDDKLLNKYDLVISIGKTIYYALAIGKLSYCYDYFGGYGFITKNNLEQAYSYNFSGREFGVKLTEQEILYDILNNYQLAQEDLSFLKEFAFNNFSLTKNMENLLEKLKFHEIKQLEIEKLYKIKERKSNLFVEQINHLNNQVTLYKNELENDLYKKKYEEITSSTSWRITKPLRVVKEIIYNFKDKLRSKR